MKIALLLIAIMVIAVGAVEAALRLLFGFGNPPLYVADPQVGYRLAPNQRVRRFGNRIEINQYSMRGGPIAPTPDPGTVRILLLGDSIANGGWWTDQPDILSAQIERRLTDDAPQKDVEVLNASANSWGPRNELAYLMRFGSFGSRVVVLLINTDDLFATAPTSIQVGRDRNYPSRRPPLALLEVLSRLQKPKPIPELEALHQESGDRVGVNLEAIRQIQRQVQAQHGQLLLAMTPLLREVVPPGSRDYEIVARDRLRTFTTAEQIPYLDFLADFQSASDPPALYRDHIHLSPAGNVLVSRAIAKALRPQLGPNPLPPAKLPDSLLNDPWE